MQLRLRTALSKLFNYFHPLSVHFNTKTLINFVSENFFTSLFDEEMTWSEKYMLRDYATTLDALSARIDVAARASRCKQKSFSEYASELVERKFLILDKAL